MYYRLEQEQDCISIKHVETDREVGYAFYTQAVGADGRSFDLCKVFNTAHRNLAIVTSMSTKFPIQCAAKAAAIHQAYYDFPDLKDATLIENNDRVERRLGTLLADAAQAFERGLSEARGAGLTADTRNWFAETLAELASIWWISRIGSFDATNGTEEPYFANPHAAGPRLTFSGAAQAYGMQELRARYLDWNDADRRTVLNWVLQWLSDLLYNDRTYREALETRH